MSRTRDDVMTYFIQGVKGGPIKIGRTNNITRRLSGIQNGHPYDLCVLMTLNGDCERELHQRFSASRLRGEWFTPVPELANACGGLTESSDPLTYRHGFKDGFIAATQFLLSAGVDIPQGLRYADHFAERCVDEAEEKRNRGF